MITVGIVGTRGIPNKHGGFERFIELLVAENVWASRGIRFIVYSAGDNGMFNEWTDLRDVGFSKEERPLTYYVKSTLLATRECDVVLCCGVALSFFSFWPILRGRPLIVNPDGCEWRRTKWSRFGRLLVRMMYPPTFAAATRIVIDAEALREDFGGRLGKKARYIGYQAPPPMIYEMSESTHKRFALFRPYFLVIARLEPENNVGLIIKSFKGLKRDNVELVVVGGITTQYYSEVLEPDLSQSVRFVGAIYDQAVLNELRSNCIGYVHGHSVGGTNPSLLEALATVRGHLLCHDNKYNREVAAAEATYFASEHELGNLLRPIIDGAIFGEPRARAPSRDARYCPEYIACRYLEVIEEVHAAC